MDCESFINYDYLWIVNLLLNMIIFFPWIFYCFWLFDGCESFLYFWICIYFLSILRVWLFSLTWFIFFLLIIYPVCGFLTICTCLYIEFNDLCCQKNPFLSLMKYHTTHHTIFLFCSCYRLYELYLGILVDYMV